MYWRLDLHVREQYRTLSTYRYPGIGGLLGRADAGQNVGCARAARNKEITTPPDHCSDVIGGLRDLVVRRVTWVFVCRGCFDRIVLWANLPNDAGDCGRPLFAAGRNGLWIAIFDCADWGDGASLGRGTRFAESRHSRGHDRAVTCSNRNCCIIRRSDVART